MYIYISISHPRLVINRSSSMLISMLSPLQHQPWPSPSARTKTRSLHGCRNFPLLILPSLSFSLSFSLSLSSSPYS